MGIQQTDKSVGQNKMTNKSQKIGNASVKKEMEYLISNGEKTG